MNTDSTVSIFAVIYSCFWAALHVRGAKNRMEGGRHHWESSEAAGHRGIYQEVVNEGVWCCQGRLDGGRQLGPVPQSAARNQQVQIELHAPVVAHVFQPPSQLYAHRFRETQNQPLAL